MYETRFPNVNYEYFDSFDNKEDYLNEYSTYVNLFVKYLIKNTSLKKFDNDLEFYKIEKFGIESISEKHQDLYQYLCNDELKYYYVRNNVYVERLSKEEKEYLDSIINNSDFKYDEKVNKFIKDTFKKVIYEDISEETGKSVDLNFGPNTSYDFYASNDSLVIGARMEQGMHPDEPDDVFFSKKGFFEREIRSLKTALERELDMNVSVIEYDDYSIEELPNVEDKALK